MASAVTLDARGPRCRKAEDDLGYRIYTGTRCPKVIPPAPCVGPCIAKHQTCSLAQQQQQKKCMTRPNQNQHSISLNPALKLTRSAHAHSCHTLHTMAIPCSHGMNAQAQSKTGQLHRHESCKKDPQLIHQPRGRPAVQSCPCNLKRSGTRSTQCTECTMSM